MTHPANKLSNLKRRVNRARAAVDEHGLPFTCPASRHVHIVAENLARGIVPTIDAEHCAGSMLSVLESLWKARAEIARLRLVKGG